ncbi:MAG: hypothetical protein LBL82_01895 [Oscillospiraceae bacterium]|jgi:hypothetical protein|nr:hypothetical protein [Oscillospiraceae bacterium]
MKKAIIGLASLLVVLSLASCSSENVDSTTTGDGVNDVSYRRSAVGDNNTVTRNGYSYNTNGANYSADRSNYRTNGGAMDGTANGADTYGATTDTNLDDMLQYDGTRSYNNSATSRTTTATGRAVSAKSGLTELSEFIGVRNSDFVKKYPNGVEQVDLINGVKTVSGRKFNYNLFGHNYSALTSVNDKGYVTAIQISPTNATTAELTDAISDELGKPAKISRNASTYDYRAEWNSGKTKVILTQFRNECTVTIA